MYVRWLVGIVLLIACAGVIVSLCQNLWAERPQTDPHPVAVPEDEVPPEARPTAFMMSLSMDVEGIVNPPLVSADDAGLADNEAVIGVQAQGEFRAYLRSAFANRAERHIVNDRFGDSPVVVTHCDMTSCTRVLTPKTPGEPIDIHCGGWAVDRGMTLLVNGQKYDHRSEEIPLQDVSFVVTTWKKWRTAHPQTKVYLGPYGAPRRNPAR